MKPCKGCRYFKPLFSECTYGSEWVSRVDELSGYTKSKYIPEPAPIKKMRTSGACGPNRKLYDAGYRYIFGRLSTIILITIGLIGVFVNFLALFE